MASNITNEAVLVVCHRRDYSVKQNAGGTHASHAPALAKIRDSIVTIEGQT
ncbi:MAG: hypothetical protein J7641_04685 [Cyanobacteria bacterium SID2]|nr:hypothetical protein [Cyanobacteria bacterium SID2]MBP0004344.1 hypothetical protein [Cyanobacteria bacterium SBC]